MSRLVVSAWVALWLVSAAGQTTDVRLWVDGTGRPTGDAGAALALLTDAQLEGLDPLDYDAAALQAAAVRLGAGGASARDIAAFDVAMSANMLRYLRHLHLGRVEASAIGFRMPPRAPDDFVERLRAAIAAHRLTAAAAELRPSMGLYRELRSALAQYRALAADPALQSFMPPRATVHPGQRCAEVPALSRYLAALGDLPPGVPGPFDPLVYDSRLVDAVKRFQARHGLEQDGVLGKSTRAALAVPLAWRVRQIELSLERLRSLPDLGPERFLAVNIPMFRLWGMEGEPAARRPSFTTEVIVGRALNTRTPILLDTMEYVIFRPYWNVPPSILRHEILPALRRDPDYLRRHDMEMVSERGELRVRQRPGPTNSLGLVKFVFPNDDNVYLHGTPAPALFGRARRDFSHGCIRVADPVGLVEWVLAGNPGWTRDRIVSTMNGSATERVDLAHPIGVVLFYLTAVVMPEDGAVHFAEDIYGHDARLHRALEEAMRIRDVMTTKVEKVLPSDTVDHAKTLMRLNGVHHLVVVENHTVQGVITAHQLAETPARDSLTVGALMTRHVVTAPPDLPLRKAANMLRGSAVAALPVLDDGRLVGIVTVSDLLEVIGRGVERPVEKGKRWTLRNRGVKPAQARAARR